MLTSIGPTTVHKYIFPRLPPAIKTSLADFAKAVVSYYNINTDFSKFTLQLYHTCRRHPSDFQVHSLELQKWFELVPSRRCWNVLASSGHFPRNIALCLCLRGWTESTQRLWSKACLAVIHASLAVTAILFLSFSSFLLLRWWDKTMIGNEQKRNYNRNILKILENKSVNYKNENNWVFSTFTDSKLEY